EGVGENMAHAVEGGCVPVVAGLEAHFQLRGGTGACLREGAWNRGGPRVERGLDGTYFGRDVGRAGSHEPPDYLLGPRSAPENEGVAVHDARPTDLFRLEVG